MQEPIETLVVTLFEHPCLAARLGEGTIVLSIRDLCDAVGLQPNGQLRRLRLDSDLRDGLHSLRVPTGGGMQEQEFLILDFVPAWISSVNRAKAAPIVRERLRYLRLFGIRHFYDAIAAAAGLPAGPSRNIEDLRDLERFDTAIQGIEVRTRAMEESQEKARQAWRDHERRIRQIEEQLGVAATLSAGQRGHIYQLVQVWAQARVEREQITSQAAFAGCWSAIKTRYNVAKYEHIPARDYEDCLQYIRRAYQQLTGEELRLPEQHDD